MIIQHDNGSSKDMFEYWKANRKHLIDIHHGRKDFEGI